MTKPRKNTTDTSKKKSNRNLWDYIASLAFVLVGSYFLSTQRPTQGAIYIGVGFFFLIIIKSREKKK